MRGGTWDPVEKRYTCCGSRNAYHYASCPLRKKIPGRASDKDWQAVQDCKHDGYTSQQCAATLGMPLDQVNELWIQ